MKRYVLVGLAAVLAVAVVGLAGCGGTPTSGNGTTSTSTFTGTALNGAGATFPQPVYAEWAQSFIKVESGAKVNYQAIGSGGGVQQFTAKTVDFGATDVSADSRRRRRRSRRRTSSSRRASAPWSSRTTSRP